MKEKSHRSNWLHVRLTDSEAEKLEEELHRLEENNRKISASTYARQQLFSSSPERIRMMCNDIRAIRSEIHYSLRRLQESEDPNQKPGSGVGRQHVRGDGAEELHEAGFLLCRGGRVGAQVDVGHEVCQVPLLHPIPGNRLLRLGPRLRSTARTIPSVDGVRSRS